MDETKQPGILFKGVQLTQLSFSVHGPVPKPIPFGPRFELKGQLSDDETGLVLSLTADLFGRLDQKECPPVELKFTLAGTFEATEKGNMSLRDFAKHNAPAHLVPYARELIANITARSALPTLNLGPINVIAYLEHGADDIAIETAPKTQQALVGRQPS
jgi:preprotein translocase subunit SecB